jgi:D-alanyl-D-alanine carboxypeptidase
MTHTRTRIVRSAFTLLFGILTAIASPAFAGTGNDAALVMDAESGRVLYARSGDALRSPASLTKMMTLYMLFDLIDAGKISLSDEMTASAHAAAQKPTKLGLKKGSTITVEQAIYSLVIQSANDAAVVIAEHISGSEAAFAKAMTKRARDLGMKRTTFRNASGLPDAAQLTTARDMAVLSRALMRNHPTLYTYFSTTSFTWNGKTVKTHNRVLTSLNGANGIKTGYTKASGFNLTTSAQRDGKRLIGVVLGGDSWAARDEEMRVMLEAWFAQLKRRPNLVASYGAGGATVAKAEPAPAQVEVAMIVPKAGPAPVEEPRRIVAMKPIADEPVPAPKASRKEAAIVEVAYTAPIPAAKPARVAAKGVRVAAAAETGEGDTSDDVPVARVKPGKERIVPLSTLTSNKSNDDIAALIETGYSPEEEPKAVKSTGDWGIQIGAFDSRRAAATELDRARKTAKKALAKADDMVMEVTNDAGRTFFRARFTDFSNTGAQAACKALKADGFKCVTFSTSTASAN